MNRKNESIYAIVFPQVSDAQGGRIPTSRLNWMYTIGGRSTKRVKLEIRVSCVQREVVRGQRVKAEPLGSSCSYSKDHASKKKAVRVTCGAHSLAFVMHVVQLQQTK